MFCSISFFNVTAMENIPAAPQQPTGLANIQLRLQSLAKERAEQAKRDDVDTRTLQEVATSTDSDKFTQTEAHLYLAEIRKALAKNYNVTNYLNIISSIIANEAQYKDTHYAFYNTTSNMWRLTQDLYTRLYARFNPMNIVGKDFKFLRFDENSSINKTAKDFLIDELKSKGLVDDGVKETGSIMVSVNFSLFGNVGFPGECSWEYFANPQGHKEPDRSIYENMMTNFGLSNKYIDEIMSLVKIYDTKEDTIVQIFVPIEKIDEIGYLAWVKGIPAHDKTIDWVMDKAKSLAFQHTKPTIEGLKDRLSKQKNKSFLYRDMMEDIVAGEYSLDSFLKIYRNRPWDIERINYLTGRLLFTPDVLLNPESGVKFFRFATVPREKLGEYNKRLDAIIDKLIAEKEAQE